VQQISADADRKKESRSAAFARIWGAAHAVAGIVDAGLTLADGAGAAVPFLSEPWYCCAEPTAEQLVSIGGLTKKPVKAASVGADGFV
jgi:hypothetical protein